MSSSSNSALGRVDVEKVPYFVCFSIWDSIPGSGQRVGFKGLLSLKSPSDLS